MARRLLLLATALVHVVAVAGAPALATDVFASPCSVLADPQAAAAASPPPASPPTPASPPPPSPFPPPPLPPPPTSGSCSWVCPESPSPNASLSPPPSPNPPAPPLAPANTTGYELWSNPGTWPGGIVPGIPGVSELANASIPCGRLVMLDVAALSLGLLRVQGLLKVLDHPSLPSIYVKANFILVEGQLMAGTPAKQFSQKLTFELTPNPNNRAPLLFTSFAPADPLNPRNLGHKAFAVVGGQVHLHGLPGPASMPVWVKLSKTANVGDSSISVDTNVAGSWPVGARIVVASTDYDRAQAEAFTVTSVLRNGTGAVISLDGVFQFMHYGLPNGISNGVGGFVDQRAEVALLSRNIVITGEDEASPNQYEGGHFIVFMTNTPQFIEGVEFLKMGQQGTLGRYSIHFHVVGSSPETVCRKNTINSSKQRCIVVHASHNITVDSNVAFNTSGHCFMTEEGGEIDNTFVSNLGILTNKVDRMIMQAGTNPPTSDETDNDPSTFWFSNPKNSVIGNVAAGSAGNGFWIELRNRVRGMSLTIPGINTTQPISQSLKAFLNNVAHSSMIGFRFYPHGLRPRKSDGVTPGAPGTADRLTIYKNAYMGLFIHNTDYLTVRNSDFADNGWGVLLNQDEAVSIRDSRMVALSSNFGNPKECWRSDAWAPCRPVTGCTMPLQWGIQGRSTGGFMRSAPTFGVLIDQSRVGDSSIFPNAIQNVSFSNYDPSCRTASAIVTVGGGDFWNPGHSTTGLRFSGNSQALWLPPQYYSYNPWNTTSNGGGQAQFYTLWDTDGTIMGSPGYIVANNEKILPPSKQGCRLNSLWNAYICPGTCYRSIHISYAEPGFTSTANNVKFVHGNFSSLQITRVIDGQVMTLDGNLNKRDEIPANRNFYAVLLAGYTYQITVIPSNTVPSFIPAGITVRYRDVGGCGQGLTLQFQPMGSRMWTVPHSSSVFLGQCNCSMPFPNSSSNAQYTYVCSSSSSLLPATQLLLSPAFTSTVTLVPAVGSAVCGTSQCSILWGGSVWLYEDSGRELRPRFFNPQLNIKDWKNGTAVLGFNSWRDPSITTFLPATNSTLVTYYFRQSFKLIDTACYSALLIEVIVDDGIVIYLNNNELLRSNLGAGPISNATLASTQSPLLNWQTFRVPFPNTSYYLVEGVNTIAVEVHVYAFWAWQSSFDMRISGVRKLSCSGPSITPEVCDGVDNNNNGKVDEDSTGRLLTRPCRTACGNGIETCRSGFFQNCTAPAASPEVCNGRDDDCDGRADNGADQLDCAAAGAVCFRGACLPAGPATAPRAVWPRNATGWAYNDSGVDLGAANPAWRTGNQVSSWPTGQGPLGFNLDSPSWDTFGTTLKPFTMNGRLTAYFVKAIVLSSADVNATFSLDFNIRRVDGAVVFVNGIEIARSAMPWGAIDSTTRPVSVTGTSGSNLAWNYNKCQSCFRNSSAPLRVGTNWIAVELHAGWGWIRRAAFDMDLFRNVIVPCSALPGAPSTCVRQVDQMISPASDVWQYIDGSQPLPTSDWMLPSFNSSKWPSGPAPLAWDAYWAKRTTLSPGPTGGDRRRTYYFRRTVQVPDAACYFRLTSQLLAKDGAVVYINGIEVLRTSSMPTGNVNATTYANWESWDWSTTALAGGWLRAGANVLAVELHAAARSAQYLFFDWQIVGSREAVTCTPLPL